ncbi:MAG: hypothetical protein JNL66_26585 [Alphaproteobacteria bacterium]|nr:hypothetical protein [Alphaproteobacteria bacterium]
MNDTSPSRLERMIARLSAQKAFLDFAASQVRDLPGPILEIGLGKGRTFSHLAKLFPSREIYAFDDGLRAPADSAPEPARLALGDFRLTLAAMRGRIAPAALAHADFGSEDRGFDAGQAVWLAPLIAALMAPGGLVVSDRALSMPGWTPLAGPEGLEWTYHAARAG